MPPTPPGICVKRDCNRPVAPGHDWFCREHVEEMLATSTLNPARIILADQITAQDSDATKPLRTDHLPTEPVKTEETDHA